jgi:tRNA-dependent cyclodipeptide synthase
MLDINYKVRARSKWAWRAFDTVRMEISVGQDYHEDEKLKSSMDWARENFKERFIILGDTTQRYNIMFTHGADEKTAHAISKEKGDAWLERNARYLDGVTITRWDDWKDSSRYVETHKKVMELYENNIDFRQAVKQGCEDFWVRQSYPELEKQRFLNHSTIYLLEETAVFALAYSELGGISAYPGNFLDMLQMFVDKSIGEFPLGLSKAHYIRLGFERRKNPPLANIA